MCKKVRVASDRDATIKVPADISLGHRAGGPLSAAQDGIMLDQSSRRAHVLVDADSVTGEDRTVTGDDTSSSILAASRKVAKASFAGTERFVIERRLGSGGFGVVYEARDRAKGTTVALKSLQHVTPESLYRFKREFRSLADVSHPNLVQLYELSSSADDWFFTMELVKGRHFLDYLCNAERAGRAAAIPEVTPVSIERLMPAMRQLVRGLDALHRSGHVHRDVKPPNVLVTSEGRVVVLDFGLVMDLQHEATMQSMHIAGTPLYMSPEQAAALPLTAASDF